MALFAPTAEDVAAMAKSAKSASKTRSSFFAREETEEDIAQERALQEIAKRREKMLEKMKMSEGVHSWAMCPFRSTHSPAALP